MKRNAIIITGILLGAVYISGCSKEQLLDPATSGNENSSAKNGQGIAGAVYILNNNPATNNVMQYNRTASGELSFVGSFPTGGMGTGGGLGSQGAVILQGDYLYAVSAGSNEISVMQTSASGPTLIDKVSSNGTTPVSLTIQNDLLYALNSGGSGNITAFRIMPNYHLMAISGSTRPLSSAASGPAQVQFSPDGTQLVVTEKATDKILTYEVDGSGMASMPTVHNSAGATPFGFEFGHNNTLIVSDAFGGAAGQSALSSYTLGNGGTLSLVTGPVATTRTAACWVAVTNNGKYAFTTNTGSASISAYSISNSGALNLLEADAGITGGGPIDMALSGNSKFLYSLNGGSNSISLFRVEHDGSLSSLGAGPSTPPGAAGMAAK